MRHNQMKDRFLQGAKLATEKIEPTDDEVIEMFGDWQMLNAEQAEALFFAMANWYRVHAEDLTNMNAEKIADLLNQVGWEVRNRTGN